MATDPEALAVVFEFGGSFALRRQRQNGREYRYFTLKLRNTRESVVRRCHELAGCGRVYGPYTDAYGGTFWLWTAAQRDSWRLYEQMRPYLSAARVADAEAVLAQCSKHPSEPRPARYAKLSASA